MRARKFQLDPAYDQFKGTEQWRETNRIKELYESIDVDEYDETRRLVSSFVTCQEIELIQHSIHNGSADGTSGVCQCICSKWDP